MTPMTPAARRALADAELAELERRAALVYVADWAGECQWPRRPRLTGIPAHRRQFIADKDDTLMLVYRPTETQPCGVAVVRKVKK